MATQQLVLHRHRRVGAATGGRRPPRTPDPLHGAPRRWIPCRGRSIGQFEGHVLQPLIQGRMVAIHPLAIVLAVAGGSTVAGLVGAVIAVPIVAVLNVIVRYTAQAARSGDGAPAADRTAGVLPEPAG